MSTPARTKLPMPTDREVLVAICPICNAHTSRYAVVILRQTAKTLALWTRLRGDNPDIGMLANEQEHFAESLANRGYVVAVLEEQAAMEGLLSTKCRHTDNQRLLMKNGQMSLLDSLEDAAITTSGTLGTGETP